ncbi:Gfo/Idh/MocA family protein [Sedimentisphaera salicampi]|uniref:Inositol 2-dehydrogenase n=1 Tax=Sedimentisphaera salicampi TaxID=1941349 RepID=A0A1W6LJE4_9BACT|nr:Gfo/Idh/MocA family oxidoreductase [Sedimentisphaera salicampi]ARN55875.1 Inositol 2-dehydrogenase [Sedimentisphaera salicampi]
MDNITRRNFGKLSLSAAGALSLGGISQISAAASANSKVVLAVAGIRSRGRQLAENFAGIKDCEVKYVIDVDSRYLDHAAKSVEQKQGKAPKAIKDYREALDDKDVHGLVVATPEHWHAPMSIEAVKAGKHVYVEKPCCHNPAEGEMLVEAMNKYDKLIQMGNQRRSFRIVEQMIDEIRSGEIGRPYFARTWYSRKRGPIGKGKVIDVPSYLDWELWQGPAPREEYRDNVHPYNWHWFWNWGTGEALNNGTHELDVARWALGVDFPTKVTSLGGRYHYPKDDWEFFDTQNISVEFEGDKLITWEGISSASMKICGHSRGALIQGTKGYVEYGSSSYKVFDLNGKLLRHEDQAAKSKDSTNVIDPGLNDYHAENFVYSILGKDSINSPVDEGYKSILLGLLGNIAAKTSTMLHCDPKNGHILDNPDAQRYWRRVYEPGWEPKV